MVQIGFQTKFKPAVENGIDTLLGRPLRNSGFLPKLQTIRAMRRTNMPTAGCDLQLFTGLRTSSCRRLANVRCSGVRPISLAGLVRDPVRQYPDAEIRIANEPVADLDAFARLDGFQRYEDFAEFFRHGGKSCFDGYLIEWDAVLIRGPLFAASLSGRTVNGSQRDGGRLVHAVPVKGKPDLTSLALCRVKPGRTSGVGWGSQGDHVSATPENVTCKRCLVLL